MIKRLFRHILREYKIKTNPINYTLSIGVSVGNNCRLIGITAGTFGSEPYLVKLGDHVTITSGVQFITHDGGVWVFREQQPNIDIVAPITIGNNVFIGMNAIILPGVTIGDNCVIGAGSIVTRDIPSGHVAAGVPARCIKTIEEYWQDVEKKSINIRSLPPDDKRRFLEEKFGQK